MNDDKFLEDLEFNNKINTLKHFYEKNPKVAMELLNKVVNDESLYIIEDSNSGSILKKIINDIGLKKLLYIFLISCYVILGLFSFIPFYIFGFIFFLGGYFCCQSEEKLSIIFLFSHGMTGYGLMIFSIVNDGFYKNFINDISKAGIIYLIIVVIIAIIALFILIFYSLSKTLKRHKNIPIISFILFFIVLFMLKILPYIYSDIIRLLG